LVVYIVAFRPFGELLFFACTKNKSPKEMHPSFRFFLALLGLSGGNQKLAPLDLKQLLAD